MFEQGGHPSVWIIQERVSRTSFCKLNKSHNCSFPTFPSRLSSPWPQIRGQPPFPPFQTDLPTPKGVSGRPPSEQGGRIPRRSLAPIKREKYTVFYPISCVWGASSNQMARENQTELTTIQYPPPLSAPSENRLQCRISLSSKLRVGCARKKWGWGMGVLAVAFIIGPHWNWGFGAGGRALHNGQGGSRIHQTQRFTRRGKSYTICGKRLKISTFTFCSPVYKRAWHVGARKV